MRHAKPGGSALFARVVCPKCGAEPPQAVSAEGIADPADITLEQTAHPVDVDPIRREWRLWHWVPVYPGRPIDAWAVHAWTADHLRLELRTSLHVEVLPR